MKVDIDVFINKIKNRGGAITTTQHPWVSSLFFHPICSKSSYHAELLDISKNEQCGETKSSISFRRISVLVKITSFTDLNILSSLFLYSINPFLPSSILYEHIYVIPFHVSLEVEAWLLAICFRLRRFCRCLSRRGGTMTWRNNL